MSSLASLGAGNQFWEQQPKVKRPEVVECPRCKFTYFEEVKAAKYLASHSIIMGQPVPKDPTALEFGLLKCLNCNTLVEPSVNYDVREYTHSDYTDLITALKNNTDKK